MVILNPVKLIININYSSILVKDVCEQSYFINNRKEKNKYVGE